MYLHGNWYRCKSRNCGREYRVFFYFLFLFLFLLLFLFLFSSSLYYPVENRNRNPSVVSSTFSPMTKGPTCIDINSTIATLSIFRCKCIDCVRETRQGFPFWIIPRRASFSPRFIWSISFDVIQTIDTYYSVQYVHIRFINYEINTERWQSIVVSPVNKHDLVAKLLMIRSIECANSLGNPGDGSMRIK